MGGIGDPAPLPQVPSSGLVPDIQLTENVTNLGILGDENEPLLARALQEISGVSRNIPFTKPVKLVADDNSFTKFAKEMYIDTPLNLKRLDIK